MRTLLTLLVVGLLSISAFAVATDADCEAAQRDPNSDPSSKDRVSTASAPLRSNVNGGTGACEGEQWDGGDTTGSTEQGTGVWVLDVAGPGRIDRIGARVGSNPDGQNKPNVNDNGPGDAVHLRVIGQGSPGWKTGTLNVGDGTLFVGADIFGVGQAAISASGHQDQMPCIVDGTTVCSPTSGNGADGAALGTAELGIYLEDNSDQLAAGLGIVDEWDLAFNAAHAAAHGTSHDSTGGNVLASVVHFAHITQGQNVNEESPNCTDASYAEGTCTRDNTAATVELLA